MDSTKDLDFDLNMFNRLVLNLANSKVTFYDEHNVVTLMNSLPDIYKDVKNIIKYGCNALTIDALKAKDFVLKSDVKNEGLSINSTSFIKRPSFNLKLE